MWPSRCRTIFASSVNWAEMSPARRCLGAGYFVAARVVAGRWRHLHLAVLVDWCPCAEIVAVC